MAQEKEQQPRKTSGRVVGVIASYDDPTGTQGHPEAPLAVVWTVNKYRKDFNDVIQQANKKPRFSKYGSHLLYGCFKKW